LITAISHVACRVRDLESALRFYRDVLGLEESYRLSHENGELMLVALWLGGQSFLELVPARGDGEAASGQLGYLHIGVWVDDIQATLEAWAARGLVVDVAPGRGADGVLNCMIHDPEGNPIELWQNTPDSLQSRAMGRPGRASERV
jgi:catechol 2,3-dioxygenase-like lactoylglutathione lyase family enzyme